MFPEGDHRSHRNRDNMLDNFDKADTLTFLWDGTGSRSARRRSPASWPTPRSTTVLPTCVTVDEVHRCSAASDVPLTADEKAHLDLLWRDNFGVTNRYEMPLKSSV